MRIQIRPVDYYHTRGVELRLDDDRAGLALRTRLVIHCYGRDEVWQEPLEQWIRYVFERFGLQQQSNWSPACFSASSNRRVEQARRFIVQGITHATEVWEEEERQRRQRRHRS